MKMYIRYILVVSFLSFLADLRMAGCDACQDKPKFTPSKVVVKYGDPFNVTCTLCRNCPDSIFQMEYSVGTVENSGTELLWRVDKITEWELATQCFYVNINSTQCSTPLDVIVYQPPENVSISFVNHTGPIRKHGLYTLQCDVQKVYSKNLTVTFYKGQTAQLPLTPSSIVKTKPESYDFTYSFNISEEDNGAEFWCEAKLELGPEGPQPPPVVKSGKLTATVHYGPKREGLSGVENIYIKRGETLRLNCSADGNPPPSYTWMIPFQNFSHSDSVYTVESVDFGHKGEYICNISNSMDFAVVRFNVTVKYDDIIWIIIGIILGLFLIGIGVVVAYKYYKQNRMGQYSLKDVFHFRKAHSNSH